ncbi:MAG: hypothetical protein IPJ76_10625 [Flavobacteriales bacterium]|nr:MAG: hypothetical protein IPJ76_10625 [Flavobacteriales bacterium]
MLQTNGNSASAVAAYSFGAFPQTYFLHESTVYFNARENDGDFSTPDPSFSLRFRPIGENAALVSPDLIGQRSNYQNFFLPQTAPNGVVGVHDHERLHYKDVYPGISMQFYGTSAGQNLAFYAEPYSDPSEIQLLFEGQDSLHVDWLGNLKVLIAGKWILLREAVAYQVDANENVIPLNWNAQYEEINGQDIIGFIFDTYDPSLALVLQIGAMPLDEPDPTEYLCWGSYYGGTDMEELYASDTDSDGNFYLTGYSSSDFLTFQSNVGVDLVGNDQAVVVTKFLANYELDWTLFYGGSDDQAGRDIGVRELGGNTEIFVTGYTRANDLYT